VAGALLWALHPANLEPVAWISARYDLLTGLLAVAVLLLPWRAGPGHAVRLGLLLLAGLLSKEGFIAVAAVVVVDDLASGRGLRVAWPRWLAVGLAVASWVALRRALAVPAIALPPPGDLPRDLLAGMATWLGRALWPWPLTVSHPYLPTWPLAAAGGVTLAALLLLGWRRRALVACGATWWTRLPDWRNDATLFGAALRVDPGDPLGQLTLGALAAREGRLDEATGRLTAVLARDPRSVRALNALAVVHLRRGEVPAALARAREAVSLAPSWPQARLQLSGALHLSGDHGGELGAAEAALALSPGWREARLTRGFARCEVTPDPGCEADLDALERDGELSPVDALVARTEAAIRRRDLAAARERLGRLAATAPGDPRLRLLAPAVARLERAPR
jgi:hypothetical protein